MADEENKVEETQAVEKTDASDDGKAEAQGAAKVESRGRSREGRPKAVEGPADTSRA